MFDATKFETLRVNARKNSESAAKAAKQEYETLAKTVSKLPVELQAAMSGALQELKARAEMPVTDNRKEFQKYITDCILESNDSELESFVDHLISVLAPEMGKRGRKPSGISWETSATSVASLTHIPSGKVFLPADSAGEGKARRFSGLKAFLETEYGTVISGSCLVWLKASGKYQEFEQELENSDSDSDSDSDSE